MCKRFLILFLCCLSAFPLWAQDEAAEFGDFSEAFSEELPEEGPLDAFDKMLVEFNAAVKKQKDALDAHYLSMLARQKLIYQKGGDLGKYQEVDKEEVRFAENLAVREDHLIKLPDVRKIQLRYISDYKKLRYAKAKKVIQMAENHDGVLKAQQQKLVIQDKLSEASAVLKRRGEIKNLPMLAISRRVIESANKPSTNPEGPDKRPAAGKLQVLRSNKKIDIRGGRFTGGWNRVPIQIKLGDKVEITASGTWRPGNYRASCGADGLSIGSYSSSYYLRHDKNLNYCALVYKIGANGTVALVGGKLSFTADAAGLLFLDTNMSGERNYRKGSKGALDVKVVVTRGGEK
jgi:hypothetical protein